MLPIGLLAQGAMSFFKSSEADKERKAEEKSDARKSRANNWTDEIVTAVVLLPAIAAFFPATLPHVEAGFKALAKLPDWYQTILVTAIMLALGATSGTKAVKGFAGVKHIAAKAAKLSQGGNK